MRTAVLHDAEVAGPFLVDHRTRAVSTYRISAYPTVVLAEEPTEVTETNHAVNLLLERLLALELNL